ncbi:MAG: RDD family protein [Verrucomicrobiota bacterium]
MAGPGITVLKHNVPWGPFTRAQIHDGLARGDFTVASLAHAPGLKEWLPLGEVLDYVARHESAAATPTLPPVPGPRDHPPVPAPQAPTPPPLVVATAPVPTAPTRPPVLPAPPAKASPTLSSPPPRPSAPPAPAISASPPDPDLVPAPFLPRVIAFLVDCGILFVPVAILFVFGALAIQIPAWIHHTSRQAAAEEWALLWLNIRRMAWLLAVGVGWLYGAGLEASRAQATIGKRWMGLKVTDEHGHRLSFLRATGRYAAKYLSALPCFLGFMAALLSSRGRAWHDLLAGTRVVQSTPRRL